MDVWYLITKLRQLEAFLCRKIVYQIPLSGFSSEFWAFWYIVGLKRTTVTKVMSIWSLIVISVILSIILSVILFVIISVIQIKSNLLSKSNLIYYPNQIWSFIQIKSYLLSKSNPIWYPNQVQVIIPNQICYSDNYIVFPFPAISFFFHHRFPAIPNP